MAPKKVANVDLGEKVIELHEVPAFALRGDDSALTGYTFMGGTREDALINARAFLIDFYKKRGYWPITISIKDDHGGTT